MKIDRAKGTSSGGSVHPGTSNRSGRKIKIVTKKQNDDVFWFSDNTATRSSATARRVSRSRWGRRSRARARARRRGHPPPTSTCPGSQARPLVTLALFSSSCPGVRNYEEHKAKEEPCPVVNRA